jgi:hypothetical protein
VHHLVEVGERNGLALGDPVPVCPRRPAQAGARGAGPGPLTRKRRLVSWPDEASAHGESTAEALTGGYRFSFIVAVGLMVTAIALATTVLRSEARAAAEADAEPAYSEAA